MAIEFFQADLERLLAAELPRFEIAQERGGWVARDRSLDEMIRAGDREELIRKIAATSDHLNIEDRPRICGVPVLVAEVTGSGDSFEWFAVDANGRRYVNNFVHETRDQALLALNNRYDD